MSAIIPNASDLQVNVDQIDVSEVSSAEDQAFLIEKGTNILQIVARAALEVGQQIVEVQDRFNETGEKGLQKFYASIGISQGQATRWSSKYRAFCSYIELFGEEGAVQNFELLGDTAAQRLWALPTEYREAFLADIAVGETPTFDEVAEVASRPEVKLSKAEELIAAARARKANADQKWELAKADPAVVPNSTEYNNAASDAKAAGKSVARLEEQLERLQADLERKEAELAKFKFDGDTQRAERIKSLVDALTIGFAEDVVVDTSGKTTLQLETSSTDRYAIYDSGSGINVLTFQYTDQNGDSSTDLDQLSTKALTLNGGSINNAAGNAAILSLAAPGQSGSLAANADLIIERPTDLDLDALVDGSNSSAYQLFNNGSPLTISQKGKTFFDGSNPSWNITSAAQKGNPSEGLHIRLEAVGSLAGKFYQWSTNPNGSVNKVYGWKTTAQALQLNWESRFNKDLNSDDTIGGSITDADNNGLVDGSDSSAYQPFNSGNPITSTNSNGNSYNNEYDPNWI